MLSIPRYVVQVVCFTCLLGAAAAAQTPIFSLEVVAINSFPLKEPLTQVTALPGDVMTMEVLLRDWSPGGEALRACQATMDPLGYSSGDAGKIEPLDFDTTSAQGKENEANCFLDAADPRFVHADLTTIPLADSVSRAYRWASVLLDYGKSPVCAQDGKRFYFGTLRVRVSDDARGSFTLGLDEEGTSSALRDSNNEPITPVDFEWVTIEVPEDSRIPRIQSSNPPCNAIDARQLSPRPQDIATGANTVELTFAGDTEGLTGSDLSIDDGMPSSPRIKSVISSGPTVTLVFDRYFKAGSWVTIIHKASETGTRIGCLPGDANNDGVANADDVLALIAGPEDGESLPLYRSDINRDGVFSLADAVRILDLLTGPDVIRKTLRE